MPRPSQAHRTTCRERSSKARATDVKLISGLFQLVNVDSYHDDYILSQTVFNWHFSHERRLASCPPLLYFQFLFSLICAVSHDFGYSYCHWPVQSAVAGAVSLWVWLSTWKIWKMRTFESDHRKLGKLLLPAVCNVTEYSRVSINISWFAKEKKRSCHTYDAYINIVVRNNDIHQSKYIQSTYMYLYFYQ